MFAAAGAFQVERNFAFASTTASIVRAIASDAVRRVINLLVPSQDDLNRSLDDVPPRRPAGNGTIAHRAITMSVHGIPNGTTCRPVRPNTLSHRARRSGRRAPARSAWKKPWLNPPSAGRPAES